MKIYARIEDGVVAELLSIEGSIAGRFHPSLTWVDATGQAVAVGYRQLTGSFVPPPAAATAPAASGTEVATIAELRAQLAAMSARVDALV
jgi:hypothetical protein